MRAAFPAALLALFVWWSGTFVAGAQAVPAGVGLTVLLLTVAVSGVGADPFALGQRRWIVGPLLVAAVAASWALSEVARAGLTAVVLLPVALALPGAVGRCWGTARERHLGAVALVAVAAITALWGLLDRFVIGSERAAAPLGHHLLLGEVLVLLFPVTWWVAAEEWSSGGLRRALASTSVATVAGAVLATGSSACIAALAVELIVLVGRGLWRKVVVGVAVGGFVGLATVGALERLASSWRARLTYWEAALRGWWERPLLGHGPGSTGWTVGAHHRPEPGVNPPGELIGDLHSLPLAILYEVGLVGALIAAGVVVLLARRIAARTAVLGGGSRRLATAVGLGGATALTAGVTLGTPAIWVVAGIVVGWLSSGSQEPVPGGRAGWTVWGCVAALVLAPGFVARWNYERAIDARSVVEVERRLALAVEADPSFPLYRLRVALYAVSRTEAATEARRAAEEAPGVAALWLVAGDRSAGLDGSEAGRWLVRACELDPLAATAPMLLALHSPETEAGSAAAARALVAEPRLLASPLFDRPRLRRRVARLLESWPGIDLGWRRAVVARLGEPRRRTPADQEYVTTIDDPGAVATEAFSLVLFRRPPWPGALSSVSVRREVFESIDIPAATRLPSTESVAVAGAGCGFERSGE